MSQISRFFQFLTKIKKEMCFKSEEELCKNPNPYGYKRVTQSRTILAIIFYQSGRSRGTVVRQFYTGLQRYF